MQITIEMGLKYVLEASLKLYEALERSGRRNYYMGRLFRSLRILEKQQFLPGSKQKPYWRSEGLNEMEVATLLFTHILLLV